jgi:putative peptide zinc metalloprotease protein
MLEAQLQESDVRHRALVQEDRVKAQIIEEQRRYIVQGLDRARERKTDLTVRSRAEGVFVLPQAENLPGRYVRKGQQMAHVVRRDAVTVRTVIPQQDIDLVRHATSAVEVRLAERRAQSEQAVVRDRGDQGDGPRQLTATRPGFKTR